MAFLCGRQQTHRQTDKHTDLSSIEKVQQVNRILNVHISDIRIRKQIVVTLL